MRYRRSIVVWLVLGRGITDVPDVCMGAVLRAASSEGDGGGGDEAVEEALLDVVDLGGTRFALLFSFDWLGNRGMGSFAWGAVTRLI